MIGIIYTTYINLESQKIRLNKASIMLIYEYGYYEGVLHHNNYGGFVRSKYKSDSLRTAESIKWTK
jgi:hypothetical protein